MTDEGESWYNGRKEMRDAGMKTVKIFLASSVVELEDDRNAIGNFVRALRDIYDARGVKIELYDCTYENQAMTGGRKQDEHNEHARQSDMFLALFYNKAGKFTVEEFHEAYKQLQNTGAPAILVCFREGAGYAPKDSLLAFRDELEDELEQHPITYTGIDSVNLKVLLQMKRMNLDVPIGLEESAVTVGGTPVLTLKREKNTDSQRLKDVKQLDLASRCNNLGNLCVRMNRFELAEKEYLRAKEIREQLAAEHPSENQPDLASTCNNLGALYADMNCLITAEQEYLRAKEIYEQLAVERPSAYQPNLASICNNLGVLYYGNNRMELAEQEYLRAKELYEQLTALVPERYAIDLVAVCANLGELYEDTDRPEQAAAEYARAEELWKQAKTL